jgi:hypothetical protein
MACEMAEPALFVLKRLGSKPGSKDQRLAREDLKHISGNLEQYCLETKQSWREVSDFLCNWVLFSVRHSSFEHYGKLVH